MKLISAENFAYKGQRTGGKAAIVLASHQSATLTKQLQKLMYLDEVPSTHVMVLSNDDGYYLYLMRNPTTPYECFPIKRSGNTRITGGFSNFLQWYIAHTLGEFDKKSRYVINISKAIVDGTAYYKLLVPTKTGGEDE